MKDENEKPRVRVDCEGNLYHYDDEVIIPSSWGDGEIKEFKSYKNSLFSRTTKFKITIPVWPSRIY